MTNPHPLTEVEVTQADREAAAALGLLINRTLAEARDMRRAGADQDEIVQAFARHRLSTSAQPSTEAVKLADELEQLVEKAFSPNARDWYVPWRVVPSDGKPIIAGSNSGNLFRGFIGTWQDADLVVALVNNLPAILAALRQSHPLPSIDEVERVALALCNAEQKRLDMPELASIEEFRFESDAQVYMLLARAAIAALMRVDAPNPKGD